MSTSPPTPVVSPGALAPADPPHVRLVRAFLTGRSRQTLRAYARDLNDFARWCGAADAGEAARLLLPCDQGRANEVALSYRQHLQARGLAPATVNRRLAALRSLVKLARTLGMVDWALDVDGPRGELLRDTRGPGREGFRRLLAALAGRADAKGHRDRAVLRLLFDLALRRAEVVSLDVEHVDLDGGAVAVLGKGRLERVRLTLPGPTREALATWLAVRGDSPGPLFTSCDRARKGGGRLTGGSVYEIVRGLGERAGLRARPHGLRHAAITEALDRTGGNIRAVQKFSRHRDVRVLERYDDYR